jgi:phosphate transport system ATP-binding protein
MADGSLLHRGQPVRSAHADLHDADMSPREPATRVPCGIALEEVTVRYGELVAIERASLAVRPGELMALVGPSGCGKTSLLNTINRLTDLFPGCTVTGSIRVGALDVRAPRTDLTALRRKIGMVFQQPNPFPLSIADNLRFPLREHGIKDRGERDRRTEEALRAVGLWEEVEDRLGQSALALSGGQQQRLCIARTLVLGPEVLLFDEPCSALDPVSAALIEGLIAGLKGRYTILMVTHNLAQARRLADTVSVCWVSEGCGCVVESGPCGVLFERSTHPITRAYCGGQLG